MGNYQELLAFQRQVDYSGTEAEWVEEYNRVCDLYQADPVKGLDEEAFGRMLDDPSGKRLGNDELFVLWHENKPDENKLDAMLDVRLGLSPSPSSRPPKIQPIASYGAGSMGAGSVGNSMSMMGQLSNISERNVASIPSTMTDLPLDIYSSQASMATVDMQQLVGNQAACGQTRPELP